MYLELCCSNLLGPDIVLKTKNEFSEAESKPKSFVASYSFERNCKWVAEGGHAELWLWWIRGRREGREGVLVV